jgi:hypothetical protein
MRGEAGHELLAHHTGRAENAYLNLVWHVVPIRIVSQEDRQREHGLVLCWLSPLPGAEFIMMRRACLCVGVVALTIAWMPDTHAAKSFNIREPVLQQVMNPCDPAELVFFTGDRTVSLFLTETKNTFHLHGHLSHQGVTGVGLVTGDEYRLITVENFHLSTAKGATQTVSSRVRLIRLGRNQNLHATSRMHITIDANGRVTANIDTFTIECH